MTYRVEFTETFRAYVDIEAPTAAAAERLAERVSGTSTLFFD